MGEKIAVATCAAKAVDKAAAASCFTKVIGGDGAKIAACATGGRDKMVSCLLGDKPEYKAAAQVVACVQGGRDASSLVANCSDFLIKDPKTRAVLACAAQAGGLFQARTRGLGQSPTSVSARRCETLPG